MSLALRLVSTLVPMLLIQVFMQATGPLGFFYVFLAVGCCIPLLPGAYRRVASLVFFSLGACVGLTLIVIQPLSGFLVWFDLVPQGAMRGPVSVVFMYLSGYLSLVAVYGLEPGRRLKSLGQLLLVNTVLAFVIFRLGWLLALAGLLLPVLVAMALSSRPAPLHLWRGLVNLAGLGLMAALVTLASTPGRTPAGIFLIDEYLSGFLRTGVFRLLPEFPVLYGFSGYGHGFSEEKLGVRPLLSERALFTVEGRPGFTHYLRTKAYDIFTGTGWAVSAGHPDRQASGLLAASRDGSILLNLRLLMDYYQLLPQILDATTVLPSRSGDGLLFEGSLATGLTLSRPLLYGERLVVVSAVDPTLGPTLGPESIIGSVPLQDAGNNPEFYLSVPDAIPPVARELAATLHGLSESELPGELARLLAEGFTYSLDLTDQMVPAEDSGGRDFLQHFLADTRTGYCVHFASAAVLLARLAGVPARYVTGFLVSIPLPDADSLESGSGGLVRTEITGLNSHAWAELWLPSSGWTSFEATPPMRQTASEAGSSGAAATSLDEFTLRQLAAITGGRIDLRDPGGFASDGAIIVARLAIGLLVFALVILAGAGLYRIAGKSGWSLGAWSGWGYSWADGVCWWGNRKLRRAGNPGLPAFRKNARQLVRLAADWGVQGPERNGWLAWEEGVAALLARHGVDLDAGGLTPEDLGVFRAVFFGCRSPESQDFAILTILATQLRGLPKRAPAAFPVDMDSAH